MSKPKVSVLGVYGPAVVTEEHLRQEVECYEGNRAEIEAGLRQALDRTVLVECLVDEGGPDFDPGEFVLPAADVPEDSWQTAWAEAYLGEDGSGLIAERWDDPPDASRFRVAFYMHGWDDEARLRFGSETLPCPPVQPMPPRLLELVPYEFPG